MRRVIVGQDRGQRLGGVGRGPGEQPTQRSGLDRREHGVALDTGEVVGHPVDHRVGRRSEGLGIHVDEPVDLGPVEAAGAGVGLVAWTIGLGHGAEST